MAEHREPPAIVEGATTADVEDEVEQTAKSAEDRKAAAAMAALDARDEDTANKNVDQEAVSKAMSQLKTDSNVKKDVKKAVKVDAADVALLRVPDHISLGVFVDQFVDILLVSINRHRSISLNSQSPKLRSC
ncbi:hypothetical protein OOU_Y34scaffold00370g8 [Pyricularia oryzae Y34]|uniref:Nascent polypeptide-associated complex subunit alpha-like UBA domain-containing protein n=2 Tax=Pyricularia oryzae TaxID=318829 RepID=A0AA97PN61_PYRO3|nr:hypothetical protein OOU_Y34scaffold00370g8 [Pyricularia oryzae Y34]